MGKEYDENIMKIILIVSYIILLIMGTTHYVSNIEEIEVYDSKYVREIKTDEGIISLVRNATFLKITEPSGRIVYITKQYDEIPIVRRGISRLFREKLLGETVLILETNGEKKKIDIDGTTYLYDVDGIGSITKIEVDGTTSIKYQNGDILHLKEKRQPITVIKNEDETVTFK